MTGKIYQIIVSLRLTLLPGYPLPRRLELGESDGVFHSCTIEQGWPQELPRNPGPWAVPRDVQVN